MLFTLRLMVRYWYHMMVCTLPAAYGSPSGCAGITMMARNVLRARMALRMRCINALTTSLRMFCPALEEMKNWFSMYTKC